MKILLFLMLGFSFIGCSKERTNEEKCKEYQECLKAKINNDDKIDNPTNKQIADVLDGFRLCYKRSGLDKVKEWPCDKELGGQKSPAPEQAKWPHPGTEDGLRSLMDEFIKDGGANAAKLSLRLRPTAEDYAAVFEGDMAKKAEETYKEPWEKGMLTLKTKPEQTEIKVLSVTSEDLKTKTPRSQDFPAGWLEVAPNLKAGLTIYLVRLTKPGEARGMRFDGLIYVNRRWRIFPKPWHIK